MSAHEGSAAQENWDRAAKTPDMVAIERRVTEAKAAVEAKLASERRAAEETEKSDPLNDELQAMRSVARTLEKLDFQARERVLAWLHARFRPSSELMQGTGPWNVPR